MFRFPTQLAIGPVRVAPATVLAPMAGVTDTVFRRFIRNLGGCGLLMTEFTSSHGVRASLRARKPTRTLLKYLAFDPVERPITAQLFGADPAVMADAARVCQDLGFDVVDINFGCPVNKVVRCNGGSGLLRDLPLVERLLREVRAAISIPLTIKFRAGWNDRELVGPLGAPGRRLRSGCRGAASPHARAGLQRPGRLDAYRRSESRRAASRSSAMATSTRRRMPSAWWPRPIATRS
jgi:tRNA-dihydrouridine synthase